MVSNSETSSGTSNPDTDEDYSSLNSISETNYPSNDDFALVKQLYSPIQDQSSLQFGQSVSMSDRFIVIGSPGYNGFSGAAYLYDLNDFSLIRTFLSPEPLDVYFGSSVVIDNDYVLIGAYGYNNLSGAAYLYKISDPLYQRVIIPSDSARFDYFGLRLVLDGENIVISSIFDETLFANTGSVYLYKTTDPDYERKLIASDADADDYFGDGISIYGDYLLVGAPSDGDLGSSSGSAYLDRLDDPMYERKITPSDGKGDIYFGQAVSVYGNHLAISATHDGTNGQYAGAAYIFKIDDLNYERKILSSVNETNIYFGYPVIINDDYIFIGSRSNNDSGEYSGSVSVFKFDNNDYELLIKAFDAKSLDHFSSSLSINQDYLLISSPLKMIENRNQAGAAYVYSIVK
jgi:hypothetical protein